MSRRRTIAISAATLSALTAALVPAAASPAGPPTASRSSSGGAAAPAATSSPPHATSSPTPCPTWTRVPVVSRGQLVRQETFEDGTFSWTQAGAPNRPRRDGAAGRGGGAALFVRNLGAAPLIETVDEGWNADGEFSVSLFIRLGDRIPRTGIGLRVLSADGTTELAKTGVYARSSRWIKLTTRYQPGSDHKAHSCNGAEVDPWDRARAVRFELTASDVEGPVPLYVDDVAVRFLGPVVTTTYSTPATPTPTAAPGSPTP
ncbi:MAG: hypothetical protein U0Q15_08360 [Kineosporiaceae bacterium]